MSDMPDWMANSLAVSAARSKKNEQEKKADEDRLRQEKIDDSYRRYGATAQAKAEEILKDFVNVARHHPFDVNEGWIIRSYNAPRLAPEGAGFTPAVLGIVVDSQFKTRLWTPISGHDLRPVGWDPTLRVSGVEILPSFSLIFEEHCGRCAPGQPRIGYGGHENLLGNILSTYAVQHGWV